MGSGGGDVADDAMFEPRRSLMQPATLSPPPPLIVRPRIWETPFSHMGESLSKGPRIADLRGPRRKRLRWSRPHDDLENTMRWSSLLGHSTTGPRTRTARTVGTT